MTKPVKKKLGFVTQDDMLFAEVSLCMVLVMDGMCKMGQVVSWSVSVHKGGVWSGGDGQKRL